MPYCVADRCSNGISSGRASTINTPRIAVNEIDEAMSSPWASITGATAAIAELPQIELPAAIKIDSLIGKPRMRLTAKLALKVTMTAATIAAISQMPDAMIAAKLIEAP